MYTSINLTVELHSDLPESKHKEFEKRISKVLTNSDLHSFIKTVKIKYARKLSPLEVRRAGGYARAAVLTPKERKAIALRAAEARWGKKTKNKIFGKV